MNPEYPNLLIVDDQPRERIALRTVLEPLEVNLFEAASGQEALALLLRHSFMLVVMDVRMPVMDGMETAELMRKNKATSSIPIIFLTAYDKQELSILQGYQLGAIDYMLKPINEDVLLNKIDVFARFYRFEREREQEREQERERERQAAELRRSNEELLRFANIVSHDLKEPLRTVRGFAKRLIRRHYELLDDEGREALEFMVDATGRMSQFIQNLMDYSKLDGNLAFSPLDCNALLGTVEKDLSAVITEAGCTLHIADLPQIYGSRSEIMALFQNLITNAIKFRKPDKPVLVGIQARENLDSWEFEVSDNGIGIAEDQHQRIFEIFRRLQSASSTEGAGIGLAHCKRIVELHGGQIWVESEPGKGSTFFFTIPKSAE